MANQRHVLVTNKQSGFSLVELLVVLLLMGLVASLAFPRIQSSLLAYERDAMEDKLFVFLRQQVAQSNLTGKSFIIPEGAAFELTQNNTSDQIDITFPDNTNQNPAGLFYQADSAVFINSHGVCATTKISLMFNNAQRELVLNPPFCKKA